MAATYTKLKSGNWGIKVVGEQIHVGQRVPVMTKGGVAKAEIVERILWTDMQTTIAAIVREKNGQPQLRGNPEQQLLAEFFAEWGPHIERDTGINGADLVNSVTVLYHNWRQISESPLSGPNEGDNPF